jgi:hypothetical protein
MRGSINETVKGMVKNGFDYVLQVWVKDFIIMTCGHCFDCGCSGRAYSGQDIRKVYKRGEK